MTPHTAPTPTVSIIIPMYNARATVAATINSLLRQTLTNWEAIIIDDGSTDGCARLVEAAARREPRIRLISQRNAGPGAARNAGLDLARGEYLAFLDPDDTLYPGAYETLLTLARSTPHRAALGSWDYTNEAGHPLAWAESAAKVPTLNLEALLNREYFAIHAQLLHRDTLGGLRFDPALRFYEDFDLFARLAIRGVEWATTDRIVCTYRLRSVNRASPDIIRRFHDDAGVIRRIFSQARAAGWGDRIDLTPARETGLMHQHALRFAHLTLLDDPSPSGALAAEIFASIRSTLPISPNLAAQAIRDFQFVDRLDAADMPREIPRYAAALAAWWRRCTAEGWAGPGFEADARRAAARELASMQDFSGALLNRCGASRDLIILGFGRNGQRLAREMARRGLPITVRDDGLNADTARARAGQAPITFINRDQPYDPEPLYLLSVLSDEAYLQRLPRGLDLVRWADHYRHSAEDYLARLINHWPADVRASRRAA
ncbi:MAG: glycosyltransferase [Phycisphaerales bacterium]|nr:glycosyltransferase [Phycisphaerales bacterium]